MTARPSAALDVFERTEFVDCRGEPVGQGKFLWTLLRRRPVRALSARDVERCWQEVLAERRTGRAAGLLTAYIHVPFCRSRCGYCFLYADTAGQDAVEAYLRRRLFPELAHFRDAFRGSRLDLLAVGGGTPSLLTERQLEALLSRFHSCYELKKGADVTFECDPRTVTEGKMRLLKAFGVTRISMGVQSLDAAALGRVNRAGQTRRVVLSAVETVLKTGFRDGLNADLLAGLPGKTPSDVVRDFEALAGLGLPMIVVNFLRPPRRTAHMTETGVFHPAAARSGDREAFFQKLARRLPPVADRLGFVYHRLAGRLSDGDHEWEFARKTSDGPRQDFFARIEQGDPSLRLLRGGSIVGFGSSARSRLAGRLFYWDKSSWQEPFSPAAGFYRAGDVGDGLSRFWRLLIALRGKRRPSAARIEERFGPEALSVLSLLHRLPAAKAGAGPRRVCVCQIGDRRSSRNDWLDFPALFNCSLGVEAGGRTFEFRVERLRPGGSYLRRAGGLGLQLQGSGAVPSGVLADVESAFELVATRHGARCLAEVARLIQRVLSEWFARAGPGSARALEASVRAYPPASAAEAA